MQKTVASSLPPTFGLIVLAGALFLATPAASAGQIPIEALLMPPVTPGKIALLATYREDPRILDAIRAALSDGRADVRRAAGRVIATSSLRPLAGQALAAFRLERDPEAAVELGAAVALNTDGASDQELLTVARGLGDEVRRRVGLRLAWARGDRALEQLDDLARSANGHYDANTLAVATRSGISRDMLAQRALRAKNVELWHAVLMTIDWAARPLDPAVVRDGLTADPGVMRSLLLWEVIAGTLPTVSPVESINAARRAIVAAARETADAPSSKDGDAPFALALLQRFLGERPSDDPAILAALDRPEPLAGDR